MINFAPLKESIVNLEYGWNKPATLLLLIPIVSQVIQVVQSRGLIEKYNFEKHNLERNNSMESDFEGNDNYLSRDNFNSDLADQFEQIAGQIAQNIGMPVSADILIEQICSKTFRKLDTDWALYWACNIIQTVALCVLYPPLSVIPYAAACYELTFYRTNINQHRNQEFQLRRLYPWESDPISS